ncbi:MAG: flippase-like domain-containing protein [Armatimonadetes bacterium]|nr:flippase-like domain-containing protein [Armatimonadota bacterium]
MVWVKRLVYLLLAGVALYLFWPLAKEIRDVPHLFVTARWEWLPAIIAVQVVSYFSLAWLNQLTLRPFPGHIGLRRMAMLLTSVAFIEVAVPSAGVSGFALRARLLRKHGYSVEVSSFTFLLESVFLVISMVSVAVFGIVHTIRSGRLDETETSQMVGLAALVALLTWAAWHLLIDPQRSRRAVAFLGRLWNRWFGRLKRLDPEVLEARLEQFQTGVIQLRQIPIWWFFVAAYGRTLLDVASLGLCFLLFGYEIRLGALLTGYSLMLVLSLLAILPAGIAIADASLMGIFSRLGVPPTVALAASLVYRLLAYWLMRFIGFVSLQLLEREAPVPAPRAAA